MTTAPSRFNPFPYPLRQGSVTLGCLMVTHLRTGLGLARQPGAQPWAWHGWKLDRLPALPGTGREAAFPCSLHLWPSILFPPPAPASLLAQLLTFSVTGWKGLQDQPGGPQGDGDLPGPVAEQGLRRGDAGTEGVLRTGHTSPHQQSACLPTPPSPLPTTALSPG